NIAMIKGKDIDNNGDKNREEEWIKTWTAFEEAANTRSSRITSNLISLCRFSMGIADYSERVSLAIKKFNDIIFDKLKYPNSQVKKICRTSIHWVKFFSENGPDATREMFHDFFHQQAEEKPIHVENLRNFAQKLLELLNSKYKYLKIIFEIEN
ncbi:unnamed protein product, partial [marine sediment metagenome]